MARASAYFNAFTAGEIGPDAWERSDLQQHSKGCRAALNYLPLTTGPLRSRTGFLDRGAAGNRLVAFVRSASDALFLDLGHLTARVWSLSGDVLQAGGGDYVFATPWPAEQLGDLWFKQVGDILYVTDRVGRPTRAIRRLADTTWTVDDFVFGGGPWLPEDPDGPSLTFTPEAGYLRITADADVFSAADVGVEIRYRESDGNPGLETWTSGTDYIAGTRVQFDGRGYLLDGGPGKSGTTPPLHQRGKVSDGKLIWGFDHDGAGIMRVTTYVGPREVVCASVVNGPGMTTSPYWAKGRFSSTEGWPRALAEEREERLCFAATLRRPGTVEMTRTAGWRGVVGDFKPGLGTGRVVDDDAVSLDVGGSSRVVWLMSASALIAGCNDGEYIVSGATLDDPITPAGRKARPVSEFGSADVAPVKIQGPPPLILHVERGRTGLRELSVAPDNSVESHDRSVLPHHIHDRGLAELAWASSERVLWTRLDDGGLAAMRYHVEHGVYAATRQPLPDGWSVESLACAPLPGKGDAVALIVSRVKGGLVQRRFWLLAQRPSDVFVDGALIYEGEPVRTVTGLGMYEGETVAVVADGARVADQVVTDATIVLPQDAARVVAGQPLARRFECLPIDMEGVGSTNGRMFVPTHAVVIIDGVEVDVTDDAGLTNRISSRSPTDQSSPSIKRLRQRVALGSKGSRDARFVVETSAPFDLTLAAYRLEGEVTA